MFGRFVSFHHTFIRLTPPTLQLGPELNVVLLSLKLFQFRKEAHLKKKSPFLSVSLLLSSPETNDDLLLLCHPGPHPLLLRLQLLQVKTPTS